MTTSNTLTVDGKRYTERLAIDRRSGLLTDDIVAAVQRCARDGEWQPLVQALAQREADLRTEFYAMLVQITFLVNSEGDEEHAEIVNDAKRYLRGFPHFGEYLNGLVAGLDEEVA